MATRLKFKMIGCDKNIAHIYQPIIDQLSDKIKLYNILRKDNPVFIIRASFSNFYRGFSKKTSDLNNKNTSNNSPFEHFIPNNLCLNNCFFLLFIFYNYNSSPIYTG
uniref:Uncharacterized protein n=1 Tax=Cacopsylla melanoneura TaxID=428564 RepID=A0A8D8TAW1_9HEMI